jgi:hypothetical protein
MLSFDLETTGPDITADQIICAAVYDPDAGIEKYFIFPLGDSPEEFMQYLDRADRLCAFNGARFDLPLIEHWFKPGESRMRSWRLKLHDVYEACALALGISFSLQSLLEMNGIPGKTGTGLTAIQLALQEEWVKLGNYCIDDTKKTHQVSSLQMIQIPKTHHSLFFGNRGIFTTNC